ncbi:ANK_REP_REGION domain-containing protein [Trichonephila clavata]|uniref:ANK_REP_REGION domain-containing protein n=1 Tax=Trichonephila clavata TaxID=2740835 RepID=A0A8X6JPI1_TRICU|nr:ANK_REP_REGION domain-containing protein [Trichonephila clavata]
MWGDMGYQGKDLKDHIKREYDIEIEIVKRPPSRFWVHKDTPPELLPKVEPGFKVQPRRIYAKNNPIRNLDEEFRTHINFKDEKGNTLLHHAVIGNKTEEITTLLVTYSANPLIQNADNKIPLDLAQGKTKEVLIKSMKKQANTKKESAMIGSLMPGIIIGSFLGVVLGAGVCVAVSLSGGMILGVMIASVLVIAVGLAMYFLSQDYEQAKAIEKTISTVSSEISVDGATAANEGHNLHIADPSIPRFIP